MAKQAAGSALVRFGDTMVLAAVTVSANISTLPFFPLTVEYREKTYAAGKIPGGFIKREGRPSDDEILAARIIDRSIRPLFPEGFKNEVQVFVYVISADQENDADVLGARRRVVRAERVEDPVQRPDRRRCASAACRELDPQPDLPAARVLDLDLVVAGSADSIVMVEGGALEVSEADVVEALKVAQKGIKELIGLQKQLHATRRTRSRRCRGRRPSTTRASWTKIRELAEAQMATAHQRQGQGQPGQRRRGGARQAIAEAARGLPRHAAATSATCSATSSTAVMRQQVLEKGERVDGRDLDDDPSDRDRDRRAAARARLGAVHARADAGARRRHARHRERRAAPRHHRRGRRDHQVVHAALQLPAVLDRRGQADARHEPPRDRPRQPGRARAAGRAAALSRTSRTRSASSPTSSSRTARRRWPSVCGGSLALLDAGVPMQAPSPASRWG